MNKLLYTSRIIFGLFLFCFSIPNIGLAQADSKVPQNELNDTYQLIKSTLSKNPALALKFAEKLIDIADQEKDHSFLAKAYNLRGYILTDQLEFKGAMRNYYEALKHTSTQDKYNIYIYSNIGWTYTLLERYEDALQYLLKAQQLSKSHNDFLRRPILGTMGLTYLYQKDFSESLTLLNQRLSESLTVDGKLISHLNLGYYYLIKNELDSADFHLTKTQLLSANVSDFGNSYSHANLLSNLGHLALKNDNLKKAQKYLETTHELSENLNLGLTIDESLDGLLKIFLKTNDVDNYHKYSQKLLKFRDQKKAQLEDYYIFELERKEKQLAEQKLQVSNKEIEKNNVIWVAIILSITLILTLVFGFLLFRQRSRIITNPYTGKKINLSPFLKYLNHYGYDLNQISTILEKDAEFWLDYNPNDDVKGEEILRRLENFEKLSRAFKEISEPSS